MWEGVFRNGTEALHNFGRARAQIFCTQYDQWGDTGWSCRSGWLISTCFFRISCCWFFSLLLVYSSFRNSFLAFSQGIQRAVREKLGLEFRSQLHQKKSYALQNKIYWERNFWKDFCSVLVVAGFVEGRLCLRIRFSEQCEILPSLFLMKYDVPGDQRTKGRVRNRFWSWRTDLWTRNACENGWS